MDQGPRITPLPPEQWTQEQRLICEPIATATGAYNVLGIYVRHWEAFKAMRGWGSHILGSGSTLGPRYRELVILRTAVVMPSEYEWAQHKPNARQAGLTDAEIERIKVGSAATGWTPAESALLNMVDDLLRSHTISQGVWQAAVSQLSTQQIFDVVYTVGQYFTVAVLANTVGIEVDTGLTGFDPDKVF